MAKTRLRNQIDQPFGTDLFDRLIDTEEGRADDFDSEQPSL